MATFASHTLDHTANRLTVALDAHAFRIEEVGEVDGLRVLVGLVG
jgi:hypothetical protein